MCFGASSRAQSPQPLPVLPALPQLSGWTAAPSASIMQDDAVHRQYPFSSQHLGVLFSMLQDMRCVAAHIPSLPTACKFAPADGEVTLRSDSPWAKASAVSYDVVAMERWMNVLLAQRLDGCAPAALS